MEGYVLNAACDRDVEWTGRFELGAANVAKVETSRVESEQGLSVVLECSRWR